MKLVWNGDSINPRKASLSLLELVSIAVYRPLFIP